MQSEFANIADAAEVYLDALYRGDANRLGALFVAEANLYASVDGNLETMPIAEYLDMVGGRPSPQSQGYDNTGRIVAIDMSGPESAIAKLEVTVPPRRFIDFLSFLCLGGEWRVISKIYHIDA